MYPLPSSTPYQESPKRVLLLVPLQLLVLLLLPTTSATTIYSSNNNNMTSTTTASGFNYPHRVLTPIEDTPGYSSLQKLQKELYANAQAMHSNACGGNHGHLALVMPDADYLALAGEAFIIPQQAFIIPQHPGILPIHAQGTTGA
jgi:hypothetical protein